MFLPEAQGAAEGDHGHDDDDLGQVAFFAGAFGQPEVGEEADPGEDQQDVDKRIVQGLEELHHRVGRLVVGDLVVAFTLQAARGVQFGEAVAGGLDVAQGGG